MSKTINGNTLQYVYDRDTIILDVDGSGVPVTRYLHGHQLIMQHRDSTEGYYSFNGHGDTIRITDASGLTTLAKYSYDAWGTILSKDESGTSSSYLYAGYQYDADMKDYYLRARYYRPSTGRFISADPYWTPQNSIDKDSPSYNSVVQSNNLYVYCVSNPIRYIDSDGNSATLVLGGSAATILAALLKAIGIVTLSAVAIAAITKLAEQAGQLFYAVDGTKFGKMYSISIVAAFSRALSKQNVYTKNQTPAAVLARAASFGLNPVHHENNYPKHYHLHGNGYGNPHIYYGAHS